MLTCQTNIKAEKVNNIKGCVNVDYTCYYLILALGK